MAMGFGLWIEDEEEFAVEMKIDQSLLQDKVAPFLEVIESDVSRYSMRGQEFLMKACAYYAFECATLMLNGETPLILDVNRPTPLGMYPIHYAAGCAGIIELLLWHGARADLRCRFDFMPEDSLSHLPIDIDLLNASHKVKSRGWVPGDCIFRLVTLICSLSCTDMLECIELLAWKTKGLPDEFLRYAREGNISHVALLLAVARPRLSSAIISIRESMSSHSSSLAIPEDKKEDIALLLDVFQKAGDALQEYMRRFKPWTTMKEISKNVAVILSSAGFPARPSEFPTSVSLRSFKMKDLDDCMEHYRSSGNRWMTWGAEKSKMAGKRNREFKRDGLIKKERSWIPTSVDVVLPIPIPLFTGGYDLSAAEFKELYADFLDTGKSKNEVRATVSFGSYRICSDCTIPSMFHSPSSLKLMNF